MGDLKDVELARPGVWPLASGKTEFTAEHLRDAAEFFAATGGQAIPLALGHSDPRFSGDPAFGTVRNVRYEEDDRGPVLKGDLMDMPEWLHAAAPRRWPNRSIEGFQDFEHGGRKYKLVLTALALLGVTPPGVRSIQSLQDLQLALAASAARRIVASAPVEEATAEPPPDEQPADPQAPASSGASSYPPPATAPEVPQATAPEAEEPKKRGAGMDPAKIREALGLSADASDDEVKAAIAAEFPVPESPPLFDVGAPAPVAAGAKPGTIVLASSVWEETQKTIKKLTEFVDQTKRNERDEVIAKAVVAGKFTPAQKTHFSQLWDADPDRTRALIAALTPNSALAVMASGYADGTGEQDLDAEYAHLFSSSSHGRRS